MPQAPGPLKTSLMWHSPEMFLVLSDPLKHKRDTEISNIFSTLCVSCLINKYNAINEISPWNVLQNVQKL